MREIFECAHRHLLTPLLSWYLIYRWAMMMPILLNAQMPGHAWYYRCRAQVISLATHDARRRHAGVIASAIHLVPSAPLLYWCSYWAIMPAASLSQCHRSFTASAFAIEEYCWRPNFRGAKSASFTWEILAAVFSALNVWHAADSRISILPLHELIDIYEHGRDKSNTYAHLMMLNSPRWYWASAATCLSALKSPASPPYWGYNAPMTCIRLKKCLIMDVYIELDLSPNKPGPPPDDLKPRRLNY